MPQNRGPRILLWDVETDGLQGDLIMCIGYKWAGEKKTHLLRAEDYSREGLWDDKGLVSAFVKVFESCDYHVTWYGGGFDLPLLKSRMMKHGLRPLMPKRHEDLWKTARFKFKHYSNRLAAWQDHLNVKTAKTNVSASKWIKARYGHKPSLAYVYEHCIIDVDVLEKVFNHFRPWLEQEPAHGLFTGKKEGCRSCGSKHLHQRGYKVAAGRTYRQYVCLDCGRWQRGTKAVNTVDMR